MPTPTSTLSPDEQTQAKQLQLADFLGFARLMVNAGATPEAIQRMLNTASRMVAQL